MTTAVIKATVQAATSRTPRGEYSSRGNNTLHPRLLCPVHSLVHGRVSDPAKIAEVIRKASAHPVAGRRECRGGSLMSLERS